MRTRHGRLPVVVALAVCAAGAAPAWGNGRPPATSGVYLRPGTPGAIYLRTTFGLLVSQDDGCSFRWVCEKAIGYGGEFDPKYVITPGGTLFATTFEGLRVSRDGGCTWATATAEQAAGAPGRIADLWIDAIDLAPTGDLWVATAESAGLNDVYHSTDDGVTFQPRGLSSATVWWKSLEVAPSRPQRVYVTGYQVAPEAAAFLHRTDDTGATWTAVPLPASVVFGATPLVKLAAVDPTNPDHVLLISVGAHPPAGDRLYRSLDAGATFAEALVTTEPIKDVVFRGTGAIVVAASGGGTYQAQGTGAFTALGQATPNAPDARPPQLGCLVERADGQLLGCGANWQPDYMALGRATEPVAFQKVFRFVELAGPLACPAGTTTHTECEPQWPALQQQFGATGPAATCEGVVPPPIDAPPEPRTPGTAGGCCDAGAGAPADVAALVGLVGCGLAGLGRRRRARR